MEWGVWIVNTVYGPMCQRLDSQGHNLEKWWNIWKVTPNWKLYGHDCATLRQGCHNMPGNS